MENSNFNENDLIINSENEEITANNDIIDNEQNKSIIVKKSIKWKDIPFIIYPLILSGILLIISLIALLIIFSKYEKNFIYEENAYIKPKYSSHKYSTLTFNNGLKLLLIQVNQGDPAGGSISFDYGYLDNKYEPGFLKLAFLSLISHNITNSKPYKNYLGDFNSEIGKYYSNFYFQIFGDGFQNYLKYFAELTYLKDKGQEERYSHIGDKDLAPDNNFEEKRNHLLDFLVYGYNNSKGRDFLPQGNNDVKKNLKGNYTVIESIMKLVLSDPSKIKIVLYSHYKFSLMKKYFLKAFNNIINRPKKNNDEIQQNAYDIGEFSTNKIIYYVLNDYDNNYIEINYFLSNNVTHGQLIKDSEYLNYIIYILNQTDENSLYHELNNNEDNNLRIKSLHSYYEVVLKSKIKFSVIIELNYNSYKHINEIISKVYNYINNIILYINNNDDIINDIRIEELDKINDQNFTFTEDFHKTTFYKDLANSLFYKDEKNILLKQMQFSKKDFIENITKVKMYFNQLTLNNSVIFIGLNRYIKDRYNLTKSKEISYIFQTKNALLNLRYSSHKLDEHIKPTYDNNYTKLLNPKKNEYVSQFDSNSELDYNKDDYDNYFKIRYKEINESSNDCLKVYWKRDTSFHIPKILTTIFFFHPFSRPNQPSIDKYGVKSDDRLYFEYILYFAYIKRALIEQLSDAFRAGNSFYMEYKENFFVLDLFFYSDINEKAMKVFNNIISDKEKFMTEIKENFDVYKNIAFEDYDLEKNLDLNRKRFRFYQEITKDKDNIVPHIYNHYNFPKKDFLDKDYNYLIEDELSSNIYLIKHIFLFGYCNETDALNIYNVYNVSDNFKFNISLDLAGYTGTGKNAQNFVEWTLKKSKIEENNNATCSTSDSRLNRYIIFSNFSLKYSCICNMLINILEHNSTFKENINLVRNYEQNYIYILFLLKRRTTIENTEFMNNINRILSGIEDMNLTVDLIGDRFYYFLNGFKNFAAVKHTNLFESAWWIAYDKLYKREVEGNNDLNFQMDNYQDFLDEIKRHINKDTKYIDIIQEKK